MQQKMNNSTFNMEALAKEFLEQALQGLAADGEFKLLLPIPKVAKVLGINERMAYQLIGRRILPSIKIGRKYLCPVVPLLGFIEQQALLPHEEQVMAGVYLRKQTGKSNKQ